MAFWGRREIGCLAEGFKFGIVGAGARVQGLSFEYEAVEAAWGLFAGVIETSSPLGGRFAALGETEGVLGLEMVGFFCF